MISWTWRSRVRQLDANYSWRVRSFRRAAPVPARFTRQTVILVKSVILLRGYLGSFHINDNIAIVYNSLLEIIFPALDIFLIDNAEICDCDLL